MSFDSLINSRIIALITGEPRLLRKRTAFERRRAWQGAAQVAEYFHEVADPYPRLTAQVLRRQTGPYRTGRRRTAMHGWMPRGWKMKTTERRQWM